MEESYLDRLEKIRWPDGRCCSFCGSDKVSAAPMKGRSYRCYKCKTFFSVMSKSFMSHSKLSAEMWFLLIDLADTDVAPWMITRHTGTDHGIVSLTMKKIRAAAKDDFLRRIKIDIAENGA